MVSRPPQNFILLLCFLLNKGVNSLYTKMRTSPGQNSWPKGIYPLLHCRQIRATQEAHGVLVFTHKFKPAVFSP